MSQGYPNLEYIPTSWDHHESLNWTYRFKNHSQDPVNGLHRPNSYLSSSHTSITYDMMHFNTKQDPTDPWL